ncbi:MAG: acyl-CoA thioesterase [Xanthomonadales bacterium]|nr:acyl-CoA thioesterase [Xanthomonadales bacterium]
MIIPDVGAAVALARVEIDVRWRDLDAFNHVNNSVFLTYLEEARLHWLAGIGGAWIDAERAPVIAATQVDYRAQIGWPGRVVVTLSCLRVGTSSLTIGHRIGSADDALLHSEGHVVLVWIDPRNGRPVALPDAVRVACEPGARVVETRHRG